MVSKEKLDSKTCSFIVLSLSTRNKMFNSHNNKKKHLGHVKDLDNLDLKNLNPFNQVNESEFPALWVALKLTSEHCQIETSTKHPQKT